MVKEDVIVPLVKLFLIFLCLLVSKMYKVLFVLTFLVTGMDYGLLWKEELQNTNHLKMSSLSLFVEIL